MANRLFTSSSKWPKAFLLSLVMIFAIEAAISTAPAWLPGWWAEVLPYSRPGASALRFTAKTEISLDWPDKILIMGSSQAKEDLDGVLMEKALAQSGYPGLKVVNVAVGGGMWPELYMQLDRIGRPRILVVSVAWYGLYIGPTFIGMKNYTFSWDRMMRFSRIYGTQAFWRDGKALILFTGLRTLFPSLRYFQVLTESPGSTRVLFGKWFEPRPALLETSYTMSMPRQYYLSLLRQGWSTRRDFNPPQYRKLNQRIAESFVREVKSRGIQLVFLDLPTHPAQAVLEGDIYPWRKDYQNFMTRLAKRYSVTYAPFEKLSFVSEENFADFMHLNLNGRKEMTIWVTENLIFPILKNLPPQKK